MPVRPLLLNERVPLTTAGLLLSRVLLLFGYIRKELGFVVVGFRGGYLNPVAVDVFSVFSISLEDHLQVHLCSRSWGLLEKIGLLPMTRQ